jgi:hypothetical protein
VSASPDGGQQFIFAAKADGCDHIGGVNAMCDQPRPADNRTSKFVFEFAYPLSFHRHTSSILFSAIGQQENRV